MFQKLSFIVPSILIGAFLLVWAIFAPHSSQQPISVTGHPPPIALSEESDLPATITDATGHFVFSSVSHATHQVYLIESTLPERWQTNLSDNPVKLMLNPGTTTSHYVTPWVVLEAHYQDDAIAGVVFADLDQDGQMSAGDVGLSGVTVVDPGLHQYYVPFDDEHLWQLFNEANLCQRPDLAISTILSSTVSLTASADDTQWFYDHWEDGYDADPLSPGPTTETGALNAGGTEIFPQAVDTTDLGNPANLQYDGKDRITLFGEAGSVTRMIYPATVDGISGVVLATAWEVPDVAEWDTYYIATVGEDLDFNASRVDPFVDDFDYAGLEVMAAFANTQVYYNGTFVATLEPGDTHPVYGANNGAAAGGVNSTDVITATRPIQVQTFVGGCGMTNGWSSQGYTLLPLSAWDTCYWAPVPDFVDRVGDCDIDLDSPQIDDRDIDIYIHNPHDTVITVTLNIPRSTLYPTIPITIPAHTTQSVLGFTGWDDLPPVPDADNTQAFHFDSPETFWAVAMIDSSTAGVNEPRVNDWGYSLVPRNDLSSQVVVGWAPGRPPPPPLDNGNLAFVTVVTDTVIYVDLDQDGTADNFDMNGDGDAADANVYGVAAFNEPASAAGVPLLAGQVLRVGDPNDYDMRGAMIYSRELSQRIAVAWGQDACAAHRGAHLDLGYTTLPVSIPIFSKDDDLAVDADGSGDVSPGDTLTYTVVTKNNGFGAMTNVVLTDHLPYSYTNFEVGSITSTPPYYDSVAYDDGSGLFISPETQDITAFRLTWTAIPARATITVTFRIVIRNDIPPDVTQITNQALVDSDNTDVTESDDPGDPGEPGTNTLITQTNLRVTKTDHRATVETSEFIVYDLDFYNDGPSAAKNVVITDTLPVSATVHGASASPGITVTILPAPPEPAHVLFAFQAPMPAYSHYTGTITMTLPTDYPKDTITNTIEIDTTTHETNTTDNTDIDTDTLQQTPTPTPTGTPPTSTPTPTGTPPTSTPTPTGTPPTPTPTPTGTPPTPTPTSTGTPPTPTPTGTPTLTPTPGLSPPLPPPHQVPPSEIPEPLTLVLIGGGLAILAGYARRRRR